MAKATRLPAAPPALWALVAALAALAGGLLYAAASAHLERACAVRDTPYLPLCASSEPHVPGVQELRQRLARNPGDSIAWVALANTESGAAQRALLPAIAELAPSNSNVLRLRARDALMHDQPGLAVKLLVQMTEYNVGAEAPQILGRLVANGSGAALLRPHLAAGTHWLPRVLDSMSALKLPLEPAFPLLAEAAAQHLVPSETVQAFVRSLKAQGKWADAYGLWIAQQRQPVPVLFNGSFDQNFQPDGFDWEVTPSPAGRAGAIVSQTAVRDDDQVLEVRYTGLPIATPVVRQYLFISPGRYALHGRYMASQLRSEQGLAWAARCVGEGPGAPAGRSEPLVDTKGSWKNFSFEILVPQNCGLVTSLQLETFAAFEAAGGVRGTAAFDVFELRALN